MSTVRPGQVNVHQPVLLVIDVQVGNTAGAWEHERVVGNVGIAVLRARELGVPVVWVQHEADDMPRDSAAWQLRPELPPVGPEELRIYKRYESSFEETPLEEYLERLGATHLLLAGAATNWCIRAAAYAALERGYDLTLVSDAHTTGDMQFPDGTVVPAAHIIRDLNLVMTWITYPGRKARTQATAELTFAGAAGL
jgi:nicotinamidase-related amidase